MEINNHRELYNLLLDLQGKRVLLVTKTKLRYETSNIQVINTESIIFNDRKGNRIFLSLNQIEQVTEVGQ